jgi:hypothetical protein
MVGGSEVACGILKNHSMVWVSSFSVVTGDESVSAGPFTKDEVPLSEKAGS